MAATVKIVDAMGHNVVEMPVIGDPDYNHETRTLTGVRHPQTNGPLTIGVATTHTIIIVEESSNLTVPTGGGPTLRAV